MGATEVRTYVRRDRNDGLWKACEIGCRDRIGLSETDRESGAETKGGPSRAATADSPASAPRP